MAKGKKNVSSTEKRLLQFTRDYAKMQKGLKNPNSKVKETYDNANKPKEKKEKKPLY